MITLLCACGTEPPKDVTHSHITTWVNKYCQEVVISDLTRQGAYQQNDSGYHRYYKCKITLMSATPCVLPTQLFPKVDNLTDSIHLIGNGELIGLVDYLFIDDEWQLNRVILSADL